MPSLDDILAAAIQRHQAGDLRGADQLYRQILAQDPANADALHLLGMVAHQVGEHEAAIQLIRQALRIDPRAVPFHNNLGGVLQDAGRLPEAMQCFQAAIQLHPHFADGHYNLANTLRASGRLDEAVAEYQQALRCRPDHAEAYNNLGNVFQEQGRRAEAVDAYRHALRISPQHAEANCNLVHQLQHLCAWDELIERSHRVVVAVEEDAKSGTNRSIPPLYFISLAVDTTPAQQLQCARHWVQHRLGKLTALARRLNFQHSPRPEDQKRIRLGYLSADFRAHPVGWAIRELLERHDRQRFETIAYSCGPDDGSLARRQIVQACDRFIDIRGEPYSESAKRIFHADRIDILVDLMGHTRDARTEILALRPAPVQIQYLGYPGTMGAAFVDYLIADEFVLPPSQQANYDEKLVHLPCCFFPHDSRRAIAAEAATRAQCGLPEDAIVFCCFNNSYKITPQQFAIWLRLLAELPGSVLWLSHTNEQAVGQLRAAATRNGLSPDRLVFAPVVPTIEEHLARYRLADLFLDTYPYNAHATACDALWGGCPVLTRAGNTFASRVAGSMLHAVGLPDLVTYSADEYASKALSLAHVPAATSQLKSRLAEHRDRCALFDGVTLVRALENAYTEMWQIFQSGQAPRAIPVS